MKFLKESLEEIPEEIPGDTPGRVLEEFLKESQKNEKFPRGIIEGFSGTILGGLPENISEEILVGQ